MRVASAETRADQSKRSNETRPQHSASLKQTSGTKKVIDLSACSAEQTDPQIGSSRTDNPGHSRNLGGEKKRSRAGPLSDIHLSHALQMQGIIIFFSTGTRGGF